MKRWMVVTLATLIIMIMTIVTIALVWAARAQLPEVAHYFLAGVIVLFFLVIAFLGAMGYLIAYRHYRETHSLFAPSGAFHGTMQKIVQSRLLNPKQVPGRPRPMALPKPGTTRLPSKALVVTPSPVWEDEEEEEERVVARDRPLPVSPAAASAPVLPEDLDDRRDDMGIAVVKFGALLPNIREYATQGKLILGISQVGMLIGTLKDLLAVNIVGQPGRGKTSFLYFLIAQLMLAFAGTKKGTFWILDPNATLMELKAIFNYAQNKEEISRVVPTLNEEFEARQKSFELHNGKCVDPPFVLIVDEVPAIAAWEVKQQRLIREKKRKTKVNSLIDFLQEYVLEGRKYNMYLFVAGQSMPATILPTLTRDNLTSHYVFYCSDDHAKMAGLRKKDIPLVEELQFAGPGYCILDASLKTEAKIIGIPETTVEDILALAGERIVEADPIKKLESPPAVPSQHRAQRLRPMEVFAGVGPVDQELVNEIVRIAGTVKTRTEIRERLPEGHRSQKDYKVVQAVCDSRHLLVPKLPMQGRLHLAGDGRPHDLTEVFAEEEVV
jgi:hypothetical protein